VKKKFEGAPEFIREFCLNGATLPVAVYRVRKPDRKKGHKDFLLLSRPLFEAHLTLVMGMNRAQMVKHRFQQGLQCTQCANVLFSPSVHATRTCFCKKVWVDGGKDYLHASCNRYSQPVEIDLLTGKFKVTKVPKSKKVRRLI
jgi:hypothetical protein